LLQVQLPPLQPAASSAANRSSIDALEALPAALAVIRSAQPVDLPDKDKVSSLAVRDPSILPAPPPAVLPDPEAPVRPGHAPDLALVPVSELRAPAVLVAHAPAPAEHRHPEKLPVRSAPPPEAAVAARNTQRPRKAP
jgi:hypothetical protein